MAYRFVEHTADVAFEVDARTLEELFAEALRGLSDVLGGPPAGQSGPRRHSVRLTAAAIDLLLVDWLNEALYAFDTADEVWVGAQVRIAAKGASGCRLEAEVEAASFDPHSQEPRAPVKAVTYHGLAVERRGEGWWARVVLDV